MTHSLSSPHEVKTNRLLRQGHPPMPMLIALGILILQGLLTMTWSVDETNGCTHEHVDSSLAGFKESKTPYNATTVYLDVSVTNFLGVRARAFDPWPSDLPLPCVKPDKNWNLWQIQRSPAHEGFLMVKEMKTGSSSAVGINLRIARNVARRYFPQFKICKLRNDHANADSLEYGKRNRSKSFLWTVLRDPTKRIVSQFFHFQVSRQHTDPTDEKFQEWIKKEQQVHHYYLRSLAMEKLWIHHNEFDPILEANKIINAYDFIGVTERMDESAVALQLLLGLTTGDILFLNSKSSGGFDDGASPLGCVYIVPSFVSPGMKEYFHSPTWRRLSAADTLLHRAANRSLDLTIIKLGSKKFEGFLNKFRWAQKQVRDRCLSQIETPCTSSGEAVKQPNCFWGDSGCGTWCVDKVAEKLGLYSKPFDPRLEP